MGWLVLLGALLGGLGFWLLIRSRGAWRESGLPGGRVTYVDTGAWDRCERPLFSRRYRLTGRPDYLVRGRLGVVPVEVKSGPAPGNPYPGHILQLAAYCLLLEDVEGRQPPYGILKYDDRAFEVDYTSALRSRLLEALDDIRRDMQSGEVDRDHEDVARCRGCGYRERCGQALA